MNSAATLAAIDLLLALVQRAAQLSTLIEQARAQSRDISDAELEELRAADDLARQQLEQAIEQARNASSRA